MQGIIHRVLCYQKKSRTKINYDSRQLWSAWFTVLKFLVSNEVSLLKKFDIFHLALQIVNMVNLFITYGDTFLLTANSYDELYYEIIRCQQTFEGLYSLSKLYYSWFFSAFNFKMFPKKIFCNSCKIHFQQRRFSRQRNQAVLCIG